MKLNTYEWGAGDRVAVLIHGIMADHRTWRRLGPLLAERGYRVVGVDLAGHGASPRGAYDVESLAEDLLDSVPGEPELAVGHSLGGLVLARAVRRLRPARAVFSDPAWHLPLGADGPQVSDFVQAKQLTRPQIRAFNPRWESVDVDIEMETLAAWDPDTAPALAPLAGTDLLPAEPAVPSLVVLADPSFLISPQKAEVLRSRGFTVRSVPGAGHTIHRDDFEGFVASLDGWL
ncbi:alpha/beta hydrolase [Streptomyces sp. NPDC051940]|uniref:alpha/beta fold hydrolase n=1 Tax=Streptomyces sp. NPDC051940 TaxID=3155675 RepID=UPI0034341BB3